MLVGLFMPYPRLDNFMLKAGEASSLGNPADTQLKINVFAKLAEHLWPVIAGFALFKVYSEYREIPQPAS